MRLTVIADEEGTILAHARVVAQDEEAPNQIELIATPGQILYELDVPEEIAGIESATEFYGQYKLDMKAGEARLITRSSIWNPKYVAKDKKN